MSGYDGYPMGGSAAQRSLDPQKEKEQEDRVNEVIRNNEVMPADGAVRAPDSAEPDKEAGPSPYEVIRNNEVTPEDDGNQDELRAWVAALWMALTDLSRAYREFAWAAAHGGAAAPRPTDPVYAWAEQVGRAVPSALRAGTRDEAERTVDAHIRARRGR